ncbi:MAG: LysM peptidoglycan-binding domain-containing protein [Epulopiscium sp.]|nr:LysM peptidoglycan-binding domain-containing protein [Candidatus Epulonipiscium sp.]
MDKKNWIEEDDVLEEKDFFEKEEEKRMREELDSLLKNTNPLNKASEVTKEELESFYSISAKRRSKKRDKLKDKIVSASILVIGIILIVSIIWMFLGLGKLLFKNKDHETLQSDNSTIELLNNEINRLKQENEALYQENIELRAELEQLKFPLEIDTPETELNQPIEEPEDNNDNDSSASEPEYYIVKTGDTLWNISKKLYGSGKYYKNIIEYNNLKDENDIYRGMRLAIPKL